MSLKNIDQNDQLYKPESWQEIKDNFGNRRSAGIFRTAWASDEAGYMPRPKELGFWHRMYLRWIV